MSLLQYIVTKRYIVTVEDSKDLTDIYNELESLGNTPPGLDLVRDILCIDRRPSSRNTMYLLTDWEAGELLRDPRIKYVSLHPQELGISAGLNATTQTSSDWDKSFFISSSMKNWGLLRCYEGVQRSGWGYGGTAAQTGTIEMSQTGKNVDVIIVDGDGIVFDHPEYAVNADGTGGSRAIQYNWYQHNPQVSGGASGTYVYGVDDHATHVAGTVAGNTQGWARDANIYNLYFYAGLPVDPFSYVFDYIRQFHANKSVNINTGRKNPTIVNNSWGWSIFPGDWEMTDITAVTYRGTRYTPTETGVNTYFGTSGICNANSKLADLLGFEDFGNRITTSGSGTSSAGNILSFPGTWTQDGGQVYLSLLAAPASVYTVTMQGPCTVELISNVASGGITGITTLTLGVTVTQGASTIATYTEGPTSSSNGGQVELIIDQTVTLPNTAVYTITYNTTLVNGEVSNPLTSVTMSTRVVVETGAEAATVTSITPSLGSTAGLTASTTPTVGSNDDGYWDISLPFTVNFLGASYTSVFPGTNGYLTFGSGSSVYYLISVTNPNLPKIMWCAKDRSVQRIYHGVEGTGSGTYTVTNYGSSAYTINSASNPTLTLQRGGTYTFNVSAATHPFWIKTAQTTGTGNAYNTGVTGNGTASGTITFTVPNDAPSTLYYICQLHSLMKGTINIVAGTRTYRIRIEGNNIAGGTVGSPGMVCEYTFYEATPAQIDLQTGVNNLKTTLAVFPTEQLNTWGFISGRRIPARLAALDADVEDAIDEGIITVGASGNGGWKHDVPGGLDWDNTFEMSERYPASVAQPYYYMRGSSPSANDTTANGGFDLPNICVGNVDFRSIDQKVGSSDCGPGVDIWAPGTYIMSALPREAYGEVLTGTAVDSRNSAYYLGKYTGTSMASPQVAGVLACALEVYPGMTQEEAKSYILAYTKSNQLTTTNGGPTDSQDVQGAPNKFLYYYKERASSGNTFPKTNFKPRPATGSVYPRTRIRRT